MHYSIYISSIHLQHLKISGRDFFKGGGLWCPRHLKFLNTLLASHKHHFIILYGHVITNDVDLTPLVAKFSNLSALFSLWGFIPWLLDKTPIEQVVENFISNNFYEYHFYINSYLQLVMMLTIQIAKICFPECWSVNSNSWETKFQISRSSRKYSCSEFKYPQHWYNMFLMKMVLSGPFWSYKTTL